MTVEEETGAFVYNSPVFMGVLPTTIKHTKASFRQCILHIRYSVYLSVYQFHVPSLSHNGTRLGGQFLE